MEPSSIHYRRRWYYVLWSALLALSCLFLLLWETPASRELASMDVQIQLRDTPPGTRVQAWAGPWAQWRGSAWAGEGAFADLTVGPGEPIRLALKMPIARRRFSQDYLPRGTWDLVMIRFTAPAGAAPRYLGVPCAEDIRSGMLRAKRRLTNSIDISWKNLPVDPNPPNRIP